MKYYVAVVLILFDLKKSMHSNKRLRILKSLDLGVLCLSINMYSIETEMWFNKLFRIVTCLRFYKLACHSFVDVDQRNKMPRSETKDIVTHINSSQSRVWEFSFTNSEPQFSQDCQVTCAVSHVIGEKP